MPTARAKIFLALPWENLGLLIWPKNPISLYFGQNSEMQNCQDYIALIPLYIVLRTPKGLGICEKHKKKFIDFPGKIHGVKGWS